MTNTDLKFLLHLNPAIQDQTFTHKNVFFLARVFSQINNICLGKLSGNFMHF